MTTSTTGTTVEQHVICHLTDEGLGRPGLFEAVCSCHQAITTRNGTLLALWTQMHAQYADNKCTQTSVYRLDNETAEVCDTARDCGHSHHLYAAVTACGQYWENPIRAVVDENKHTHRH